MEHGQGKLDNYLVLAGILEEALERASGGKGAVRHGTDVPFENQQIVMLPLSLGDTTGVSLAYQAMKKTTESFRLEPGEAVAELLDVIVYTAARIVMLRQGIRAEYVKRATGEISDVMEGMIYGDIIPGQLLRQARPKSPELIFEDDDIRLVCGCGRLHPITFNRAQCPQVEWRPTCPACGLSYFITGSPGEDPRIESTAE